MSYIDIDTNDNYLIYDEQGINSISKTNNWYKCLDRPVESKQNKYKLYATGDCDLSGRKYVALPIEVNINDPDIRYKYNLIF